MIPLDLNRLAVRIEAIVNLNTFDWTPGDAFEMQRRLPDATDAEGRFRLPEPARLRSMAKQEMPFPSYPDWQRWLRVVSDLENYAHRNRKNSPHRMLRDAMRGNFR